jgi:CxxC motif-containing protein (DUF1111 family)
MRTILFGILTICLAGDLAAEFPYTGGETTIELFGNTDSHKGESFSQPAPNLSLTRRNQFFIGNSFFRNPWVTAPASTAARDGLGPVFNSQSCASCHVKDGRGRPPVNGESMLSMLLRIALADGTPDPKTGSANHPVYGDQLQNRSIPGIPAEATPRIVWKTIQGTYPDGAPYELREPIYHLENPGYGPLPKDLAISGRIAPAVAGVGLLDAIPSETLIELADPDDSDKDGISGKVNRVWDAEKEQHSIGRFGWKSEHPTVRQQTAAAFHGDIGISSSLFPQPVLTDIQRKQHDPPNGGDPEVSDEILDTVVFYSKTLAVPAQRNHERSSFKRGFEQFKELGCVKCHVDTLQTGQDPDFPELSDQEIHPFSDLLLHDMGEGLSDNRPVFEASGSEWRTAPLWGIGLAKLLDRDAAFLHDGRARTIEEAILWHGGEAEKSKDAFKRLTAVERREIISFLRSL